MCHIANFTSIKLLTLALHIYLGTSIQIQLIEEKEKDGVIVSAVPTQLTGKFWCCRVSQSELHQQLEGLAAELARVQEQTRCPLQLDAYIKKLQNAKRRVVVVNNILQNTQVV